MLRAFISFHSKPSVGRRLCVQRIVSQGGGPAIVPKSMSIIDTSVTTRTLAPRCPYTTISALNYHHHCHHLRQHQYAETSHNNRSLSTTDATEQLENYQTFLANLSPPRRKFLTILREYKASNFEHDTPARFFHKMVRGADANQDGVVTMEEHRTLLQNIGAADQMTEGELSEIFDELGEDWRGERVISVASLEELWTPFLRIMATQGGDWLPLEETK